MVKVKVLKAHLGPSGFVQAGDEIEIDDRRHRDLARNGLVAPADGESPARMPGLEPAVTNADFKSRRSRIAGGAVPK